MVCKCNILKTNPEKKKKDPGNLGIKNNRILFYYYHLFILFL